MMTEQVIEVIEEVKEVVKEPEAPVDTNFARKFAALTKEEKKFREEREAFQKEKDELMPYIEKARAVKATPEDVLSVLDFHGLTFDDLVDASIKWDPGVKEKTQEEQVQETVQKTLSQYEEKQEALRLAKEIEAAEAEIARHKQSIDNLVKSDSERWEITATQDDISDSVLLIMQEHYTKTQELLDVNDILDSLEEQAKEQLLEEYKQKEALVLKSKKLKEAVGIKDKDPQEDKPATKEELTKILQSRLTNRVSQEQRVSTDKANLTREQRKALLIQELSKISTK